MWRSQPRILFHQEKLFNLPLIWSLCSSDQQLTTPLESTFQGSAKNPLAQAPCLVQLHAHSPYPGRLPHHGLPGGRRSLPPNPAPCSRTGSCTDPSGTKGTQSVLRPFGESVVNFAAKNRTGSRALLTWLCFCFFASLFWFAAAVVSCDRTGRFSHASKGKKLSRSPGETGHHLAQWPKALAIELCGRAHSKLASPLAAQRRISAGVFWAHGQMRL